jgi:phage baseplate assembly protein W
MSNINFPLKIDGRGRTSAADYEDHVKQMIELLLFTAPGERVNRPDYGTGVRQLVFAPNSSELATATEYMIQSALQRYLADVIQPEAVSVTSNEAVLTITVQYRLRRTQEQKTAVFTQQV